VCHKLPLIQQRINLLHFFEHEGGLQLLAVVLRYGDMVAFAERMQQVDLSPMANQPLKPIFPYCNQVRNSV